MHGTASSPARWAELVNELLGDPRIRERFQIWLFIYDSGNPIGYSAGRLRAALTTAVKELDPEGKDAALRRMVVIGHSQGGLLTKLTAIDSGDALLGPRQQEAVRCVKLDDQSRELLQQSMFFTPLPFVERRDLHRDAPPGRPYGRRPARRPRPGLITLPSGLS